ncbi:fungal-specific transcription factor domain-containing protein [Pilobolus umbonatus]|nr:fungal-specific transcription factor domain-containing protein [Pilobolus umbonatus]
MNECSDIPNQSDNDMPLKRTRAKRSCDFCRKRKAKCDADHSRPCSNCKAWGFNCEFLTIRKKRGPPSVYVENLEIRCRKMESLLTSLTNKSIKDLERTDFCLDDWSSLSMDEINNSSDNYSDDDYDETSKHSNHDNDDLPTAFNKLKLDDYDTLKYAGHSASLTLWDDIFSKSKTYIQWPGRQDVTLRLMAQNELLVVCSDHTISGKRAETRLDVGFSLTSSIFDDSVSTTHSQLKSTTGIHSKSMSKHLPSNAVIEKAVQLYFHHIHTFLPIVNKAKFEASDIKSLNILAQAVLAVTFRFASLYFPKLFKKATVYADAYYQSVMYRLKESFRARLLHIQSALLMTQYLDMDDTMNDSVQWNILGKAIRMAQDMGLHRSCSRWNLPASEIETRNRVFYACYVLDRLISTRAGKPLNILDSDYDTDLPVPYDEENEQKIDRYHPFLQLIQLSEILGKTLYALYSPKSKCSKMNIGLEDYTILAGLNRRLNDWRVSLDRPQDGVDLSAAQKDGVYASESRSACEDAAIHISVVIKQRQSMLDPESFGPLCLPTFYVYSMFQSSLIHLTMAIKNRDSLRRLRLMQRSVNLVKQHEHIPSARRAYSILSNLASINNISTENVLQTDMKEEDYSLMDVQLPHSPIPSSKRKKPEEQPLLTSAPVVQSCGELMPKSHWYPVNSNLGTHVPSYSGHSPNVLSQLLSYPNTVNPRAIYPPSMHNNKPGYFDLDHSSDRSIRVLSNNKQSAYDNSSDPIQMSNPTSVQPSKQTVLSHNNPMPLPIESSNASSGPYSVPSLPFTTFNSHSAETPPRGHGDNTVYEIPHPQSTYQPTSNIGWNEWGLYIQHVRPPSTSEG